MSVVCRLAPTLAVLAFTFAVSSLAAPAARASEHAAPAEKAAPAHDTKPGGEHGKTKEAEAAPFRTDVFDLGEFEIKNTLPAHHVTVKIQFALHLILSSTTTIADVEHLEHWRRRLRDQAIIAIRSADPVDFADPRLVRLRRLIMLRLRRVPAPSQIIGAYLTDFSVEKE